MCSPHVLAIPFPAQGHVIPLLELSQCLVKQGCRVTFVNTDYNHKRVVKALEEIFFTGDHISLVSVPDGMEPWEDRNQLDKLCESMQRTMSGKLQELMEKINNEGDKIDCVIGDGSSGWIMELAKKMNIRRALFWPASTALLALAFSIPKLIYDGIIDNEGTPMKGKMVQLAPNMPVTSSAHLVWACIGDLTVLKTLFDLMVKNSEYLKMAEIMVCNSTYDLEPEAISLIPEKILPVGPLLASNRLGNSSGNFWLADQTCLEWLDQQPPNSVIYIAFGSFTVFDKVQFQELALGLELSNRPFLWVVRPDFTDDNSDAYPEGFQERVAARGRLVGWAPQQKVLSHSSVACFISHCGWNSTLEGASNGVPFLCWPYFADQFLDESYICDIWKVGLNFDRNDSGIITRTEIQTKLDRLLGDEILKARSLALKEMIMNNVREGGLSNKTFKNFVEWIKA